MNHSLVIVESPSKAKTISRFLGRGFHVLSSFGHIRDLPKSAMGVDIEHDFAPKYVIPRASQKHVTAIKKAAAKADAIYFATDEDREGEAISWHLTEILKPDPQKVKRITFHEITKDAIDEALQTPRTIDQNLVDAQQARRILDRLVGYELSPFLWKKVVKGLSAGRVQSVAVRLVVERERQIQAFTPQEYWTIEGEFEKKSAAPFAAKLLKIDGKSLDKFAVANEKDAKAIVAKLRDASFVVASVTQRQTEKSPLPPFTTSTLQQEANRKLGYSSRQTMRIAQQLYEGIELGAEGSVGLITYMRTDSLNLANKFLEEARDVLSTTFGKEYALTEARRYKTKTKGAQEAHEAIRPTDPSRTPASIAPALDPQQLKLYTLVWNRAMASQMPAAQLLQTSADITTNGSAFLFRATGSVVKFDGFLKVYPDSVKENVLPQLQEGDAVTARSITPVQHFTEPPARYSEAGLVKSLEEYGIGRPSTYAPTISTIIDRGYVERFERRLKPTDIAFVVNDLLVEHFPEIVDFAFTAHMEEDLDKIARGEKTWMPVIREFYDPFKKHLTVKEVEIDKKKITEQATDEVCDKCGKPMVIKIGRFGKFLACTGYPECRNTKPLNGDGTKAAEPEPTNEVCDKCGKPMVVKRGRFGPFLGCSGYPECKTIKRIEKKTGVTCPECGTGDIVERRSRGGRTFYSCNRYPDCTFALWSKPIPGKDGKGEQCPQSGDLLVFGKGGTVVCSGKGCRYRRAAPETSE
jgi:DNA topoisomerase-1